MTKSDHHRLHKIAEDLLSLPTTPFREDAVRRHIADFCAKRNIAVTQDDVGNLIAVYGPQYKNTVFAFGAHMDHPGFIAAADSRAGKLDALFYGGVEEKYFKDTAVRFFTQAGRVRGTVLQTRKDKTKRGLHVQISVQGPVSKGDLGMWNLPAFRLRGDKLYSRACDDLVGCVSILALLDQLHRRRIEKKVMAVFTCAEEAGLQGAKHLCMQGTIAKNVRLVAIETSSVLPSVNMGDGVVIRVGDRSSIFTPALTAFLLDCAKRVQSADKTFKYQRKLMDAGTCESTVYDRFGYVNAAVCIPLGNYHNRNVRNGRIAAEYVSMSDLENMVRLFMAVVQNSQNADAFLNSKPPRYARQNGSLGEFFYENEK
jgi:putative aminopeptidase FrvX